MWQQAHGHAQLAAGVIETELAAGEGVLGLARGNRPRRHVAARRGVTNMICSCNTRSFGGCPNGMVRRRFRVDRCEAERRVRAASGLRLVCGSSMVWPHLLHTSASVRRMPWHTHIMAHLRGAPHTAHRAPCTWHTHIMYLAHPYYGTTYTSMALGRGCSLRSRVGESPTL